jgi:hypothetical protein
LPIDVCTQGVNVSAAAPITRTDESRRASRFVGLDERTSVIAEPRA